jgi:hypothetical protein
MVLYTSASGRHGLLRRKITTISTQMKRKLILYLCEKKGKKWSCDEDTAEFQSVCTTLQPFLLCNLSLFSSHTQKLFNLLCPMFWQIAAEISPFFLLTLFTLFLPLLSYSLSMYFIFPVDRFFYSCRR